MTTQTDDLAAIKARILESQDALHNQLVSLAGELQEQQLRLAGNRETHEARLAHQAELQATMGKQQGLLSERQADAEASAGTNLEAEKHKALEEARDAVRETRDHLQLLDGALDQDVKAEANLHEQIGALAGRIQQLSLKADELRAVYQRYDADHCEHVKAACLAQLAACDNEILAAQAALEQLQARRQDIQRQLAADLLPFETPVTPVASRTLVEHGIFEDLPEAQMLAQELAQVDLLEQHWRTLNPNVARLATDRIPVDAIIGFGGIAVYQEHIERQRKSNDGFYHPNVVLRDYGDRVHKMQQLLADIRRSNQEAQAQILLRQAQNTSS